MICILLYTTCPKNHLFFLKVKIWDSPRTTDRVTACHLWNSWALRARSCRPLVQSPIAGAASIFWGISKTRCFWCQNLGFFEKPKILMSLFWGISKNPKFLTRKIPVFFMSSKSWSISQEITVRIVTLHDELCIFDQVEFSWGIFFISMRGSEHFAACCLLYIK